jgi:hypothetical protein
MKQQLFTVGDGTTVLSPAEIDVSEMTFFDELENDCWKLFKDYCATMGIIIVNESNTEDFYIAKQIQEKVLDIIQESGIKLNFDSPIEAEGMEMNL